MKYILIICHDDHFHPTKALVAAIRQWTRREMKRGVVLDGNPLRPAADAVTIRVREGHLRRKNGPFARSREAVCAYVLIEARDKEEAISIASRHPMARVATIEVRPVWSELSGA